MTMPVRGSGPQSAEEALRLYTDRSGGPDACWPWTRGKNNALGYGRFRLGGKLLLAPRVAWAEENGPIPEGIFICHRCDNPSCCNPAHLFPGTHADNMADRDRKGRNGRVLTREIATEIFKSTETRSALCKRYGIAKSTVSDIKNKRLWLCIHDT